MRDEVHDLLVRLHPGQPAQSGVRELVQQSPGDLVPHSAHVESDSLVAPAGLDDQLPGGAGGQRVRPVRLLHHLEGVESNIWQGVDPPRHS